MREVNYLINCDDFEDEASHDRAKHLGDPIEQSRRDRNMASNHLGKSDGRVDVATRNGGGDIDRRGQAERIGHGNPHQASWV